MPDLSRYQSAYERSPSEREGGGRSEVPDGNYQVTVARVELKASKKSNVPLLEWTLDVLGPRSKGRKMWRNNILGSEDNIKYLKQDLFTCGVTLNHINDLNNESTLKKLIGVTLEVTKKTKGEYSNVYFNKRIVLGGGQSQQSRSVHVPDERYVNEDEVPF